MSAAIGPARAPLHTDRRGATLLEFGLVAPVMCMVLMATFDVAQTLYTRAILQGAVQKAARDSTLETTDPTQAQAQAKVDAAVRTQAMLMNRSAAITISRRFYRSFTAAAAAQAENFTDTNHNGRCDAGEPYDDANGNNVWDSDGGNAGQGGARDATLYTVSMTYPRILPVGRLLGLPATVTVTAKTILRNQPYADQQAYGAAVVRNCP